MFSNIYINKGGDIMKTVMIETNLTDTINRVSNIIAVDVHSV